MKLKRVNYRCSCDAKRTKPGDQKDLAAMNIRYHIRHIDDMTLIPNSKLAVYENEPISQIFTGRNFAVLDEIVGITGLGSTGTCFGTF